MKPTKPRKSTKPAKRTSKPPKIKSPIKPPVKESGPLPELDALGVRYHMEYGDARERFVRSVHIPWTPEQWVGVLHREGPWLSVCCANISTIRDTLMQVLAEGGWMEMRNLELVAKLLESHDGFMGWFNKGFIPTKETLKDPLYLLVQIWAVVKDKRWASWLDVSGKSTAERQVEKSGASLERALRGYNFISAFHVGEYTTPEAQAKAQFRHDMESALALARVLPALRMFTDSLDGRVKESIQGLALVRKDNRDVVLDTIGGFAIYMSETEANEVIRFWCTNNQENAPKKSDFELRPVRVTLKKGLEFI